MMIDKESSGTIVFRLGGNIMVNTDRMTAEMIKELAFSEEELESLVKARSTPISFDEDCPETTPEHALKFRRVNLPLKHYRNQYVHGMLDRFGFLNGALMG